MLEYADLFDAGDEDQFIRNVRSNLDEGAPGLNGITAQNMSAVAVNVGRGVV